MDTKFSCNTLKRLLIYTSLLLFVVMIPQLNQAQVLYGSIVGNVTDTNGAAVAGATINITHKETGQARQAVTDASGSYDFPTVLAGTYTVKVGKSGFKTMTRETIAVTLNNVTRADIWLEVGEVTENIVITAESAQLKTDRAEVSSELTSRPLRDLPVPLGRNYQNLFKTLPGMTPPENAHSIPSNPSRSLVFNVNGASRSSNNTRIDGASATNVWLPHVTAYVPALESIETVNVVTNSFDAEQGLAGGAAINVQIKSGTNNFHGSGFEFHNNQHLNARNFFLPLNPDRTLRNKGKVVYNQFGGTFGGPIIKDKLFFFTSYEDTRDRRNAERSNLNVPSTAIRNGDFRNTGVTIYDPFDASGNLIANPVNRQVVTCNGVQNVICPDRINQVTQKLIPLIPMSNQLGADPEINNYFASAPFIFDRWTLDTKVNYNVTSKFNMFGRFSVLDFYTFNQPTWGNALQGFPIAGGNPGTGSGNTFVFSSGGVYTLTSNFIIDGYFGFVRMNSNAVQPDIDRSTSEILGIDIPGMNGPNSYEGGLGRFSVDGYETYGQTENYMPYFRSDDQYQYVANANWIRRSHNIRFGMDFYVQSLNHTQPEVTGTSYGARGGFTFGNGPTRIPSASGTRFHSWAGFLLGLPTELGRLSENVAPYTTRNKALSFYVRDQWQINPRLTLSYGTRYEYFPIPTRNDRGLERYNVNTNMMEIGGVGSIPTNLGVKVSTRLFAPRLGLAWRPNEKLVIRAGYGISNDPYALARPMRTNHPILTNLVVMSENFFWARSSSSGALQANRFSEGIPPVPDVGVGNGVIAMPTDVSVVTLPDEFDRGYIQSWNLSVQRELKMGFTGEVAYVATRQIGQLGFAELNWSPVGGGQAGRLLNTGVFGRRAQTQLVSPVGNSHYDAMQMRLERRFRDFYQFGFNYTWSKSITTAGIPDSDNTLRIDIPQYFDLNRSVSNFDRTHNVQISNIIELPFGKGRKWLSNGGVLSGIVGGWQLNNIFSFLSGQPFSVTADGASLNAPESDQRADLVKSEVTKLGGVGPGNPYFDPSAFADPLRRLTGQFGFGTAGWNLLRGPGISSWDFGLFRQFPITERVTLQFRAESFNFTNTPKFNNPGTNNNTSVSNNGFMEITGTRLDFPERQFRFGLRVSF